MSAPTFTPGPALAEPKKETLFSLSQDLLALDALLDESGGELTPEVEAWIEEYKTKFTSKIDGVGWFWRTIEARIAGYKRAQEELAARRKTEENKLERLKEYVRLCLEHLGTRKVQGELYTLALQTNGGKRPLRIQSPFDVDPAQLPEPYRKVSYAPDTEALRAAAEADPRGHAAVELFDEQGSRGLFLMAELLPAGESVRCR